MSDMIYTAGMLFDCMLQAFESAQMEQAEAETAAIIAELLNCNRLQAKLDRSRQLTEALWQEGLSIIGRRLKNEPWQYIFKRAYFRDLVLKVTPDVLIPRPETELLVDWCIENLPDDGSLLDLGTGSGAIASAMAAERTDSQVTACDISTQALNIAKFNAGFNAPGRINFVQSDLFDSLKGQRFNVIAGNLPYVTEDEYLNLSPEVRDHEPKLALTSGIDGLDLIRRTIVQAPEYLLRHGAIILEMSSHQTTPAAELFCQDIRWTAIEILRDYTQRERFVVARLRDM